MQLNFCRHLLVVVGVLCLVFVSKNSVMATNHDSEYAGKEWGAPGGDAASTRYSTLSQINTKNIGNLGAGWSVDLPDAAEATPMVANGRMFVVSNQGEILALDPSTGKNLWTFTPPMPFSGKRGIGLGEGMLFAGLRDSNVIAISQETGKLVWQSHHGSEIPNQGMATAPAYGNGVVVGVVSLGDNFLRGRAIGFDAKNGNVLWSWDAVPGLGESGHETWPQDNDVWKYGGGAIWTNPAVDPQLGLVYFGTGNAVPQYGGELRPGNNLFDNCVIALDLKTGKMRWYFQAIHHDIWEADMSTPMILYDTVIGGDARKVVAAMRTDGEIFLLDRETGKPILPIEERPVKQDTFQRTSPTQPFTVGADRIGPECIEKDMLPPGFARGCYFDPISTDIPNQYSPFMTMRQVPMSYSPQTNLLYSVACVSGSWLRRGPTGWEFIHPPRIPGSREYGLLTAMNARTAKVTWQKRLPWAECQGAGGALATAGDLLFHLEPDGIFYAYDSKTGDVLWHFQTGQLGEGGTAGPSATAAMAYEAGGQEFVAVANNHSVIAFKLGGTLPERPAPTPPPSIREWEGRIQNTKTIQLGTVRLFDIASAGKKIEFMDDYGISPTRAKVTVSTTLTFRNMSSLPDTIEARDNSWSTGLILPGQSASINIPKAGEYEYISKEHPWMAGQIFVEPEDEKLTASGESSAAGTYSKAQAQRGQIAYKQSCAACHSEDLSGSDRIPPLAGNVFLMNWQNKSAADLYARTRTTMPQGSAGSLSPQTYMDIIAYILSANDYPSGDRDLTANDEELKKVLMNKN
jgi:quinohemoprotein ethanol dehydrogenase